MACPRLPAILESQVSELKLSSIPGLAIPLQFDYLIRQRNGLWPMRDQHAGNVHGGDMLVDLLFGIDVQVTGSFIQEQDGRPAVKCAGQLLLCAVAVLFVSVDVIVSPD